MCSLCRLISVIRSSLSLRTDFRCLALIAAVGTVIGANAGHAAPTNGDLLTGFNAITSGNFRSSADSEGPILIGGSLSGSATVMSLGSTLPASLSGFGSINIIGSTAGATYNANGLAVNVGTANQGEVAREIRTER